MQQRTRNFILMSWKKQ